MGDESSAAASRASRVWSGSRSIRRCSSAGEALRHRQWLAGTRPAARLLERPRELQREERVPAGCLFDPQEPRTCERETEAVAQHVIQRAQAQRREADPLGRCRKVREPQRARRLAVFQPHRGEHTEHRVRRNSPERERERCRGRRIEPLRVVDREEDGLPCKPREDGQGRRRGGARVGARALPPTAEVPRRSRGAAARGAPQTRRRRASGRDPPARRTRVWLRPAPGRLASTRKPRSSARRTPSRHTVVFPMPASPSSTSTAKPDPASVRSRSTARNSGSRPTTADTWILSRVAACVPTSGRSQAVPANCSACRRRSERSRYGLRRERRAARRRCASGERSRLSTDSTGLASSTDGTSRSGVCCRAPSPHLIATRPPPSREHRP